MEIQISDDKTQLDIDTVHAFLKRSDWAKHRTRETVVKSIENSVCIGAYAGGRQVGFARVVTDKSTFAYLCDVFVDEEYRGRGVSRLMMDCVMKHPDLKQFRRFMLATSTAHGLYAKFGFEDVQPGRFMQIKNDFV